MYRFAKLFVFVAVFSLLSGCGSKVPRAGNPAYTKAGIKLVAVLPVKNTTADQKAAHILRQKVLDELYFKGYPKVPLNAIDEKLSLILKGNPETSLGDIPPQTVKELLGVDAVIYCTLTESTTSFGFFSAPTRVTASFEMRNARTGETLWRAQRRTVERSFGYSRNDLELKAIQIYESVLQEVVDKGLATLPDGPELPGERIPSSGTDDR